MPIQSHLPLLLVLQLIQQHMLFLDNNIEGHQQSLLLLRLTKGSLNSKVNSGGTVRVHGYGWASSHHFVKTGLQFRRKKEKKKKEKVDVSMVIPRTQH